MKKEKISEEERREKFLKKIQRFKKQRQKLIDDYNKWLVTAFQNDHPEKSEED